MIFDQQALFIDNSLSTTNVIANGNGGDAVNPLFVAVVANTALTASGAVSAALQTCDAENFGSGVVTLATLNLEKSKTGLLAAVKVPYGAKKYLRLNISGSPSAGALTAGLVEDVDNWY